MKAQKNKKNFNIYTISKKHDIRFHAGFKKWVKIIKFWCFDIKKIFYNFVEKRKKITIY